MGIYVVGCVDLSDMEEMWQVRKGRWFCVSAADVFQQPLD